LSAAVTPPRVTDLRRVQAFIVVAEELHFRRAAQRLAISQSPLSRVIRKLEKELNAPLFERSRRTVRLTAAGAALLPLARRLLAEADAFVELARRAAQTVATE
jgi:DNA-binding transcriptional LysR family regulator